jgi:predicted transcriptional regulator
MEQKVDEAVITLIEEALIAWRTNQTKARGNVSLNSFADYLGVNRSLVSMWLNKERPVTDESRRKIARPIADLIGPEAYNVLKVNPPNPYLQQIIERFERIPPEKQQKLAEDAERYSTSNNVKKSPAKRETRTD